MKMSVFIKSIFAMTLAVLCACPVPGIAEEEIVQGNSVIIFDTDAGTDDACAMLIAADHELYPDYIIATGGNAPADNAVKNSVILNEDLGMGAKVVRGCEIQLSTEKNTFHGLDGLANISEQLIRDLGIAAEMLTSELSMDDLKSALIGTDHITYISVGPLTTLAQLVTDDAVKIKFDKIYVMGGGISEFNCSHNTEFNFSKNPEAVKTILASGLDITLFTLDVTNRQRITEEQIDTLGSTVNLPEYITFLRFNRESNLVYNNIDAAVLHDTLPVLYQLYPDSFTQEKTKISCDEFGHLELDDAGYPVTLITSVDDDLLFNELQRAFGLEN